jgi:hypothetical protein
MASFRKIVRNVLVWSYERGTLQYDIICALILAFIFFVPPSCFVSKRATDLPASLQDSQHSLPVVKSAAHIQNE